MLPVAVNVPADCAIPTGPPGRIRRAKEQNWFSSLASRRSLLTDADCVARTPDVAQAHGNGGTGRDAGRHTGSSPGSSRDNRERRRNTGSQPGGAPTATCGGMTPPSTPGWWCTSRAPRRRRQGCRRKQSARFVRARLRPALPVARHREQRRSGYQYRRCVDLRAR